jgi:hypothetical protein
LLSPRKSYLLFFLLTALSIFAVFLFPPIAQDPAFHDFADKRSILDIPNFLNVASNILFIVFGFSGFVSLRKSNDESWSCRIYETLLAAVVLTGIGSAYYHLEPDNERLVWDRLPMTVVFMSFLSVVLAERISERIAVRLLIPLVLLGIVSVGWWRWTELQGHGDLRPYLFVQFYPMIAIPLLLWLFPSENRIGKKIFYVLGWYALAKIFEHFDREIYSALGFISGHSLKHLASSAAVYIIVNIKTIRT